MRKKLLSILALLLVAVTGAVADPIDLSIEIKKNTHEYLVPNGAELTGTPRYPVVLLIQGGSTVTFNNVIIESTDELYPPIKCSGEGTVTIILAEDSENKLSAAAIGLPAIGVEGVRTNLKITGTGKLEANGGENSCAIGGNGQCGIIEIAGGTVIATGGAGGAGIGTGSNGAESRGIIISGGNVTATGGAGAPGIGSGAGSSCPNITISGSIVTATAGEGAPYSIGPGDGGAAGTVTINGAVTGPISDSPYSFYPQDTYIVTPNLGDGAFWATFYSDLCNYQAPEGTQVFAVFAEDNNPELTITEIEDGIINAGQGVVLKKNTEDDIILIPTSSDSNVDYSSVNTLWGTNDDELENYAPGKIYVLGYGEGGVGFYKLAEDGSIGPHKAYLEVYGINARGFYSLEGDMSGIETVNVVDDAAPGTVYDLQGRRVAQPQKGLYIVNGKLVVIK